MSSISEKKRIEAWILNAAREAGMPIPVGEIPDEEPDFRFDRPPLGIELSELLRPASGNHGIVPVEEAAFHSDVVRLAEEATTGRWTRNPLRWDSTSGTREANDKTSAKLANTVADFVRSKADQATPFVAFYQFDVPEDFVAITIMAERAPWFNSESGVVSFSEIQPQVADRISAKNKLVRTYRANLPQGAQIWLLLYTAVTVPGSMPIPYGVEDWKFPFDFDRVFWFACLERKFVEIGRA